MTADVQKHLDTVRGVFADNGEYLYSDALESIDALAAALAEKDAKIARLTARGIEDMQHEIREKDAEIERLREAIGYARDAITSPKEPHRAGEDIYETPMMMDALRRIDAALAASAGQGDGQ